MESANAGTGQIDLDAAASEPQTIDSSEHAPPTRRRIPSANAQVESAHSVLGKSSARGNTVEHPWQQIYGTKREALMGIRKWRSMTPPRERPTEYQISKVPCVKNRYMIGAIYDEARTEYLVSEAQMVEFEQLKKDPELDKKTRDELPGLWEYLDSSLE